MHTLLLTDREVALILSALQATTRSGGGSEKNTLAVKIMMATDLEPSLEDRQPGLLRFMGENSDWCDMYRSFLDQINGGRALSEKQEAVAVSIRVKTEAKRAEKRAAKVAEQESRSVAVDLNAIHAMFDKARESGLKRLCYRANGLELKPAKAHSANAGGIYVTTKSGTYLGKVMGTKFIACREATQEHKDALNAIAADTSGEAVRYGRETGECCCCGKELTDPASIAAGIGPICANKWGF